VGALLLLLVVEVVVLKTTETNTSSQQKRTDVKPVLFCAHRIMQREQALAYLLR
jgi:hypothetical protein